MNLFSWDRNLWMRVVAEGFVQTVFWMFFPFVAIYFSEVYSKETAGVLLGLPTIASIFATLLGGHLADRAGRRKTMYAGIFAQSAMFFLFLLTDRIWLQWIAFVGISCSYSLYLPAATAMIADLTSERERRHVFAGVQTAFNIGVVAGPLLGSFLFAQNLSLLLLICGGVLFLYGLTILLFFRETTPASTRKELALETSKNGGPNILSGLKQMLSDRPFTLYLLSCVLIAIVYMQTTLYLAVYLTELMPAGANVYGWMLGWNGLLVILFSMRVAKWFQPIGDRNALLLSCLLHGIGLFSMAFTSNLWLLILCMTLFCLGEMIRLPIQQSLISKYAPEEKRGLYMGGYTLHFSLARLVAPLTIMLSGMISPLGVFSLLLFCALLSAFTFWRLFRHLPAS